jgi:hypothetical protein
MHPLKIFLSVGGAIAVLSMQMLSSTGADARSYHRQYGYHTHYREYNDPDAYRTGSSHWWEEMDRQDRGGRR